MTWVAPRWSGSIIRLVISATSSWLFQGIGCILRIFLHHLLKRNCLRLAYAVFGFIMLCAVLLLAVTTFGQAAYLGKKQVSFEKRTSTSVPQYFQTTPEIYAGIFQPIDNTRESILIGSRPNGNRSSPFPCCHKSISIRCNQKLRRKYPIRDSSAHRWWYPE